MILKFIDTLRNSDGYIETIYLHGSCYRFYLMLKEFFPECEPYINEIKDHVISKYKGKFYDITGEISGDKFTLMTESENIKASYWSFHKNYMLQITECPNCDEPIVFKE
jgi:hypothetical protein